MHYFNRFFIKFNKPCVSFLCVWTKHTSYWKFWENFRKFWKSFFWKSIKMHYLADFSNKVTNYALLFCAFGRKTQIVGKFWEKFENFGRKLNRKMIFLLFLEKLLLNIEPWKITPDFYNTFSRFRGGGTFQCSPLPGTYAKHCSYKNLPKWKDFRSN